MAKKIKTARDVGNAILQNEGAGRLASYLLSPERDARITENLNGIDVGVPVSEYKRRVTVADLEAAGLV